MVVDYVSRQVRGAVTCAHICMSILVRVQISKSFFILSVMLIGYRMTVGTTCNVPEISRPGFHIFRNVRLGFMMFILFIPILCLFLLIMSGRPFMIFISFVPILSQEGDVHTFLLISVRPSFMIFILFVPILPSHLLLLIP